jgi:hypothetical protein
MKVQRSIRQPIRPHQSWDEKWKGEDDGLIACWERGREMALENSELAQLAREGRLMVLPWKGGVEKKLKTRKKFGTLKYLAMWQGIRGDDLDIDTEGEPEITCTATGMTVAFTADSKKYAEP